MSGYIKLSGTKNPSTDWTSEYHIGDENDPTIVSLGKPVNLNKDDREKLEALGAVFEESDAEESKAWQEKNDPNVQQVVVGDDAASSGPVLSVQSAPEANQLNPGDDTAPTSPTSAPSGSAAKNSK